MGRWAAIPSILEIQCQLAHIEQIPTRDVGSHRWIEPPDAARFFRSLGIKGREMVLQAYSSKQLELLTEVLFEHFQLHTTPVMIDDRIEAYCLVGIRTVSLRYNRMDSDDDNDEDSESEVQSHEVLRFDPHVYHGSSRKGAKWLSFDKAFGRSEWLMYLPFKEE